MSRYIGQELIWHATNENQVAKKTGADAFAVNIGTFSEGIWSRH